MDYSFEHEAYLKGYTAVCGIDEAGRGPLAGLRRGLSSTASMIPKS